MTLPAFIIHIEEPTEKVAGRVLIKFSYPRMYFGFAPRIDILGPRFFGAEEERQEIKRYIIQSFCSLIAEELEEAWPKK